MEKKHIKIIILLLFLGFTILIGYGGIACSSTDNQVWHCRKSCTVEKNTERYSCIGPCGGNLHEKVCEKLCGYKPNGVPRCACSQDCNSIYDHSYDKNYIDCRDAIREYAGLPFHILCFGCLGLFCTFFCALSQLLPNKVLISVRRQGSRVVIMFTDLSTTPE